MPIPLLWLIANKWGQNTLHYGHKQRISTALQKPMLNKRFVKVHLSKPADLLALLKFYNSIFRVCNNPAFLQITIFIESKRVLLD